MNIPKRRDERIQLLQEICDKRRYTEFTQILNVARTIYPLMGDSTHRSYVKAILYSKGRR